MFRGFEIAHGLLTRRPSHSVLRSVNSPNSFITMPYWSIPFFGLLYRARKYPIFSCLTDLPDIVLTPIPFGMCISPRYVNE